jgi:hypothetical protein
VREVGLDQGWDEFEGGAGSLCRGIASGWGRTRAVEEDV